MFSSMQASLPAILIVEDDPRWRLSTAKISEDSGLKSSDLAQQMTCLAVAAQVAGVTRSGGSGGGQGGGSDDGGGVSC